jgi:hypothetical protein
VYFVWAAAFINTQYLLILKTCDVRLSERLVELQKLPKTAIIALTITLILLALTTTAAAQNQSPKKTITTVNLGIYSDSACTKTKTTLNFGTINPGSTTTQTIYIKNTGNVPETLTMTANNWNPTNATSSLTLSWNQQNTVLNARSSIQATLTLTAASNTGSLTTFSCNVTLTGTQ